MLVSSYLQLHQARMKESGLIINVSLVQDEEVGNTQYLETLYKSIAGSLCVCTGLFTLLI